MSVLTFSMLFPLLLVGGGKMEGKNGGLELQIHHFSVHNLVKPFLNQSDPNAPKDEVLFGNAQNQGPVVPCGDVDFLLEIIRKALGKDVFMGRQARMGIHGGRLTFVGEPDVAKKVGSLIAGLQGAIAPRVRIQCKLVSGGGGRGFGEISRDEVSRLKVIFEGRERGRAGDRFCLGFRGEMGYQWKLVAEVAQESTILDPKMGSIALGQTVSLMVLPAPRGDGFGVFGYFLDRDCFPEITAKDLAGKGMGAIEFFEQGVQKRAFSCLVKPGISVYIPLGGERDLGLVLLVERQDPPPKEKGILIKSLALSTLPLGVYPSTLFRPPFNSPLDLDAEKRNHFELESWMDSFLDPESILDVLNSTLERESLVLELLGGEVNPALFVSGPNGVDQKAAQILDFLTKDLGRFFLVGLKMQVKPTMGGDRDWRDYRQIASLPCLSNRSVLVEDFRERGFLKDYSSEIAQKASIASPIPGMVRMGDRFRAFLSADGSDVHVYLSLGKQNFLGFRRVPPACDKLGPLMAPDVRTVSLQRSFSMKVGETVLLGEGLKIEVKGLGECRTRYALTIREL